MNTSRTIVLSLLVFLGVSLGAAPAYAQATEEPVAGNATLQSNQPSVALSVGLRGRYLYLPAGIIELFVDHATSVSSGGFGIEVTRRRGNSEVIIGLEYDNLEAESGLYLEKDDNPAIFGQYPDYVAFDGLGLIGVDATFTWGERLHDRLELRYGAGFGLAIVTGGVYQADTQCPYGTTIGDLDDPGRCKKVGVAKKSDKVPPVFPIVNAVIGLRAKVTEKVSVDLEGGLHNTLFLGIKSSYSF